MLARILAVVVMAAVLYVVVVVPAGMLMATQSADLASYGLAAFAAVLLAIIVYLAWTASTPRRAWGWLMLMAAIGALALPLEMIAFSAIVGSILKAAAGPDQGAQAFAFAAFGIAGGIWTVVASIVGLFTGLIFALGAFFTLRKA